MKKILILEDIGSSYHDDKKSGSTKQIGKGCKKHAQALKAN